MFRRIIKYQNANAMKRIPATPPTTPPTIAPVLLETGVGLGEDDDDDDVAAAEAAEPDEVVGDVVEGVADANVAVTSSPFWMNKPLR